MYVIISAGSVISVPRFFSLQCLIALLQGYYRISSPLEGEGRERGIKDVYPPLKGGEIIGHGGL